VIREVTTIAVIINMRLFAIISWITIHFGRNPMNGGNPPSDSSVVNRMNFTVALSFMVIVWFTNEILFDFAMMVTVDVNMEYTIKYISHSLFLPNSAELNFSDPRIHKSVKFK
jgi:hypothetical protein